MVTTAVLMLLVIAVIAFIVILVRYGGTHRNTNVRRTDDGRDDGVDDDGQRPAPHRLRHVQWRRCGV